MEERLRNDTYTPEKSSTGDVVEQRERCVLTPEEQRHWSEMGVVVEEPEYERFMEAVDKLSFALPSANRAKEFAERETPTHLSVQQKKELFAVTTNTGLVSETWDMSLPHNTNLVEDEASILCVLETTFTSEDPITKLQTYNALCFGIREQGRETAQAFVATAEACVAEHLAQGAPLTLSLLDFLGRLRELPNEGVSQELVQAVERKGWQAVQSLDDEVAILMRLGGDTANICLHRVFDYLRAHTEELQNGVREAVHETIYKEHEEAWQAQGANQEDLWEASARTEEENAQFAGCMTELLRHQARYCPNFLVRLHMQDCVEMCEPNTRKEDAITGTPGGASDSIIYAFRHVREAFEARLSLGVAEEGNPFSMPVYPLAKGFLGCYENSRLASVYRAEDAQDFVPEIERACVERNDPVYEYIYETIRTQYREERAQGSVQQLDLLYDLYDFFDRLERDSTSFFFDLTKIDTTDLHPRILLEITLHNQRYIQDHGDEMPALSSLTPALPLEHEVYLHTLNPVRVLSPREEFLYTTMTELGIRKKIEQNFSCDLSTLSPWEQQNFLHILTPLDEYEARYLQTFVRATGTDGFKALLASEVGKGNKAFDIYEQCTPEEYTQIFSWYARFVEKCHEVREFVFNEFGELGISDVSQADTIARTLLERGSAVLARIADGVATAKNRTVFVEKELRTLHTIDAETALFALSARTLKEHDQNFSFETLSDISFSVCEGKELSSTDTEHMCTIYEANYTPRSEGLQQALMEGFEEKLQKARFYVARIKGRVVAFDTFTDNDDGSVYFGAFNTASHVRGLLLGEALLERSLTTEGEHKKILADCLPDEAIAKTYIHKKGFVGTGASVVGEETVLRIEKEAGKPKSFVGGNLELTDVQKGIFPESVHVDVSLLDEPFVFTPQSEKKYVTGLYSDGEKRYVVYEAK